MIATTPRKLGNYLRLFEVKSVIVAQIRNIVIKLPLRDPRQKAKAI